MKKRGRVERAGTSIFLLLWVILGLSGCTKEENLNRTWSMIGETDGQALLFMDKGTISYPDGTSVLVWVKYVPSKNRAVAGMRSLSREFGGGAEQNEYTVSQWQFSCANPSSRCLRLVHYRDKNRIASYSYPTGEWTRPPKGDTRIIFDAACAIWLNTRQASRHVP